MPQVKVFMSKYFLDSDEAITGTFGGEFNNDKGAFGNATLKLLVRSKGVEEWTFIMQQDFVPVSFIVIPPCSGTPSVHTQPCYSQLSLVLQPPPVGKFL